MLRGVPADAWTSPGRGPDTPGGPVWAGWAGVGWGWGVQVGGQAKGPARPHGLALGSLGTGLGGPGDGEGRGEGTMVTSPRIRVENCFKCIENALGFLEAIVSDGVGVWGFQGHFTRPVCPGEQDGTVV